MNLRFTYLLLKNFQVCHCEFIFIKLGSVCYREPGCCGFHLRKKLNQLTHLIDACAVYEDILWKRISGKRAFLAIDNVWNDSQSIKQAKLIREAPFHKESLVTVTARSVN